MSWQAVSLQLWLLPDLNQTKSPLLYSVYSSMHAFCHPVQVHQHYSSEKLERTWDLLSGSLPSVTLWCLSQENDSGLEASSLDCVRNYVVF